MARYAKDRSVISDRSKTEIEHTLPSYDDLGGDGDKGLDSR